MEVKTIQDELSGLMGQLAATATAAPVEPQNITPPTPGTPPAPVEPPVVVEPKVVTQPQTPTAQTPVPVDPDAVVDSWDGEPVVTPITPDTTTQTPQPSAFDFSDVAKVLNKEIKSKDDLIKVVNEIKTTAEEAAKEKAALPQELVKAIEIAKMQGNYLEYLKVSSVDWSKQDPVEVFENYIVNQATDAQGNVDYEKVDAYLDKIDDFEKEVKGKELINAYVNGQRQLQSQIEAQAIQEKQQKEAGLKAALASVSDVSGFKLSPTHKEEVFNTFASGNMLKDMFYDANGNLDYNKVVKAVFITKYWDKIDNFRKTQIKNAAKRELLDNLTNPQIVTSSEPVPAAPTKAYSIEDYLAEIKKKTGI